MPATQPTPVTPSAPLLTSPHRSANTVAPSSTPMPPNVQNVVLGNLHIKPWYPSFYPEDLIGGRKADWLYVCQWCFRYTSEIMKFVGHCKVCPLKDEVPPGDCVYEKDGLAIYQIDGEEHKLYAQNLSLFSKLFLETKSVFFDASTFLYYTLVLRRDPAASPPRATHQVVGFFSKEKMSWDNNNVACILVFPPWQRRGYGQILIAASYELGRREGRFGGPERPLSTMGRKGYVAFWCGEVARFVLGTPGKKSVSVREVSEGTWILAEDVVVALREMGVVERRKMAGGNVVVRKEKVRAWVEKSGVGGGPLVDVEAFIDVDGNEWDAEEDEDEEGEEEEEEEEGEEDEEEEDE